MFMFSPRRWRKHRFIVKLNMLYSWSRIFLRALNGRALARMIRMRSMNNFRCNTVDLPHRGVLVGFIFLSSKPHRHRPEPPEGASSEGCSPADFANLSYCLHPANAMFWLYCQKMFLFCGNTFAQLRCRKCPRVDWSVRKKIVEAYHEAYESSVTSPALPWKKFLSR